MPIYLIRHGQSEFNAAYEQGGPDPMIYDARLTEKGVNQAKQARAKAADLGIQQVIVSPLTRALQTAQHIFAGIAPINVRVGLHEQLSFSGDVGRSPCELGVEFPDLSFEHVGENWWHKGQPNELGYTVETQDIFAPRVKKFVNSLSDWSARPIALVAHGNVFQELIGYQMENCEIYKYTG